MVLSKVIGLIDTLTVEKITRHGFGERILTLLKQQKRTKSWLAEQIGISKQAMNYLLNRSAKPKLLNEIASALEVNPDWLKTGKGSLVNLSPDNAAIRQVPLFKMEEIPNKDSIRFPETIPADLSYPPSSFAVILENTTMEPFFNQGSLLIFDPSRTPRNSNFVIFTLASSGQIFFRQYFSDGDDIYLKSMDPMYKTFKNEKIILLGVLIESRNQFK